MRFAWSFSFIFILTSLYGGGGNGTHAKEVLASALEKEKSFHSVYEELSLIVMDSSGHRDVRKIRRYFDQDRERYQHLVIFDYPEEIEGTAILYGNKGKDCLLYLPSSKKNIQVESASDMFPIPGTGFVVNDWASEINRKSKYSTFSSEIENGIKLIRIEEHLADDSKVIHYIRDDLGLRTKKIQYSEDGDIESILSFHDYHQRVGDYWSPNMVMKEDVCTGEKTLIKVTFRVHSADYVKSEMFLPEYLLEEKHYTAKTANQNGVSIHNKPMYTLEEIWGRN